MKIAILEWSCGGGLLDTASGHASRSLAGEGWQMLKQLVAGLAAAGLEVHAPVDQRNVPQAASYGLAHFVDMSGLAANTSEAVLRRWAEIAAECEYAWVIAPELDGLLPGILGSLRSEGCQLLNCHGEFLSQCTNKRLTAAALTAAGISHPPTIALAEVDQAWLAATATQAGSGDLSLRWIIKPACGAGGAEQRLVTRRELLQAIRNTTDTGLVQPWLAGQSASCTAIVDARGKRHWLPLVSQDFGDSETLGEPTHGIAQATAVAARPAPYVGCTFPCRELPSATPYDLLEATLDALGPGAYGPIGVDLLFQPSSQTWTVIEVNARCTSSLLAMASAYRGNLVHDIFRLLTGASDTAVGQLSERVSPFQFRVV